MPTAQSLLTNLSFQQRACEEAIDWLKDKSVDAAWKSCPRPDWILWALANVPHGKIPCGPRWLACQIARELILIGQEKGIEIPDFLPETIAQVETWLINSQHRKANYTKLAGIRHQHFAVSRDPSSFSPTGFPAGCTGKRKWFYGALESLVGNLTDTSSLHYDAVTNISSGQSSRGICQTTGFRILDIVEDKLLSRQHLKRLCGVVRGLVPEFPVA